MSIICFPIDLHDETDVEQHFISDLLKHLGYSKRQIKGKKTLSYLGVRKTPRGKSVNYRPDYLLQASKSAKCIVEAKAPTESLDDWLWQPQAYSVHLNSQHRNSNPVKYFIITNGIETRVYQWDYDQPLYKRSIHEIGLGTPAMDELRCIVSPEPLKKRSLPPSVAGTHLEMIKPSISQINEAFSKCHQLIYRNDNISQSAAFFEFVKIIALKLISDKQIRDSYGSITDCESFSVDSSKIQFSLSWIKEMEQYSTNPLSETWFKSFINSMEKDIGAGVKRRIFDKDGSIVLSSDTIKEVVKLLEDKYLFGIDADLNGRLFETFLSATMRGKDLGQYFTPRSVVKLCVKLARLNVDVENPGKSDIVYDGCCGTGGFLIDVLAEMWHQIDQAAGKTEEKKERAKDAIKTNHIWGCEIGKEPNLARITRLNMYLHGDGGATIFNLDGLDKSLAIRAEDTPDQEQEKRDFTKQILSKTKGFFSVVITNPPFAKTYKLGDKDEDADIKHTDQLLNEYTLLNFEKKKKELRSNLMFMERYHDLLIPGGRLITILDDGILSASSYSWFRNWLRDRFIVKAVVSLPGDAFQRSKARVKTSILILHKKLSASEKQGNAFMYPCTRVGIDDPSRARTLPVDAKNREEARNEMIKVSNKYAQFCTGKKPRCYVVPDSKLNDRLDVKHCLMKPGEGSANWGKSGMTIATISTALSPKSIPERDIVVSNECTETATYLRENMMEQQSGGMRFSLTIQAILLSTGFARMIL